MEDDLSAFDDDGETADIEALKDRLAGKPLPLSDEYQSGDQQDPEPSA